MKRTIIIAILMILSITLIGCGSQSEAIIIWHDKEESVISVIEDYLAETLPELEINFVHKESLTDTLKLVGNNKSTAPDMYFFAHDKIGLFAEIGILAPISDFIDINTFDDYVEMTVEAATYKDVMYQLPLYYETLLFMYNKDRLSEDEVPTTSEELYTYMQENTDARRYAFVEQYSNAYYSAGWIHGFGGQILDQEGNPTLDSQEVIDAVTYHEKFIEFMPQGQAEYATVNTLFLERKANSIIAGPWLVPQARENGIDLGFATMPTIDETNLPIAPYAGVQGIHVLKVQADQPERKAKITQIINALTNPEIGVDLALVSGAAPANDLAYLDSQISSDELVMAMKEAAINAVPMPNLPQMDVMWTTTSSMLTQIYLNDADILASITEAQEDSEDLIDLMN
ncbi:extracellular solute-binding protein [Candidatus Izemoplasma sp. B36]|uniref:extracellular solute-binding protein n=1 Tax=Candidatus Izemoplasma sp. B36 TaxID=3242468 RepID=UPI0035573B3A